MPVERVGPHRRKGKLISSYTRRKRPSRGRKIRIEKPVTRGRIRRDQYGHILGYKS